MLPVEPRTLHCRLVKLRSMRHTRSCGWAFLGAVPSGCGLVPTLNASVGLRECACIHRQFTYSYDCTRLFTSQRAARVHRSESADWQNRVNSQDRVTQKAAPGRKIELPGAAFSQERVTAGLRVASAVLARSAVSVGCLDRAERGGSVRKAALGGEPEGARIGLSEPSQRALRTVAVRRM